MGEDSYSFSIANCVYLSSSSCWQNVRDRLSPLDDKKSTLMLVEKRDRALQLSRAFSLNL